MNREDELKQLKGRCPYCDSQLINAGILVYDNLDQFNKEFLRDLYKMIDNTIKGD